MAFGSHWCYSCSRFVLISDSISCHDCDGGFLEHLHQSSDSFHRHHRSPNRYPPPPVTITRTARNRCPNPVIILRGSKPSNQSPFQMFYDDGSDSGLRPLPPSMTEFLLGSGFDRLLDQISRIMRLFGCFSGSSGSIAASTSSSSSTLWWFRITMKLKFVSGSACCD